MSPFNWRAPGTGPEGESSFGKSDGDDEPWFAEAKSSVFMDLAKGKETMEAFTLQAADFKIDQFADTKPYKFSTKEEAKATLIKEMGGLDAYLDADLKKLGKAWEKVYGKPAPPPKKDAPPKKE